MVWVELIAAILSALGVWLTARRHPWCWPVALVASIVYAWVFAVARLYSDALLQGAFVVMIVYGWIHWVQHLGGDSRVRIARLPLRSAVLHVLAGVAGAIVLGYIMQRWTNAALPWLDAALTAFSLVGQWWQARRHIAAWWLWIVVNIVYVGEYVYKDLRITAVLYAGFLVLSLIGLHNWRQARDAPAVAGT